MTARVEQFVAIDTESLDEAALAALEQTVAGMEQAGTDPSAVVLSTDGDGDRPLLLTWDAGRLRQVPGDLLGLLAAEYLGARQVTVPISANDAIDQRCRERGVTVTRTRIGSPHVIEALREVGWEANGGFLIASPLKLPGGAAIAPLPTRDSFLPLLAVLSLAAKGTGIAGLLAGLPKRYGASRSLRDIPKEQAAEVLAWLTPDAAAPATTTRPMLAP